MEREQVTRFTKLWTHAQTSVFAVISSTVTNFADAEDVLQQVSSIAVSKFNSFDPDGNAGSFTGWAIAIARYEILRHLRDRGTDRHEYIAESVGQIADAFEQIRPEYDDRREALNQCMQHLQGRPREVLQMRYGEGLKTAGIAKFLGITAGNVSVILNRTYRKLRECVDGQLTGGVDAT